MKNFMMSVSDEMWKELEHERKVHRYESIQEVVRHIIADHLRHRDTTTNLEI